MEKVRAIARMVSNWGRWGAEDERGTLNFVTPERFASGGVRAARRGVQPRADVRRRGAADRPGRPGQPAAPDERGHGGYGPDPEGFRYDDDVVVMPLQCATQWDSLAHVYYGGQLYNGFPASTTTAAGASRNGIDKIGAGIVSRGVLLDVARAAGVERLPPGR